MCFFKCFFSFTLLINIIGCVDDQPFISKDAVFQSEKTFFAQYGEHINRYSKMNGSDGKELIICNSPFPLKEEYKLYILFDHKLVYSSEKGELKLGDLEQGDLVNVIIIFKMEEGAYRLHNKFVFPYNKDSLYYYLSFFPFNEENSTFMVIPSNVKLL